MSNAKTSQPIRVWDAFDQQAENEARATQTMRAIMPQSQPGKRTLQAKAGYRGQGVDNPRKRERICRNWNRAMSERAAEYAGKVG